MEFPWKSYVAYIRCKDGPKQYGRYRRNKKVLFRNYHRVLINGKGLSFVDILNIKLLQVQREIIDVLRGPITRHF